MTKLSSLIAILVVVLVAGIMSIGHNPELVMVGQVMADQDSRTDKP